jgi:tRNA (guanine-N(7)-)-methyltransferase subunit TRM82
VGAAGAKIYTFDAGTGIQLSVWSSGTEIESQLGYVGSDDSLYNEGEDVGVSGQPGKRRKLSPAPSTQDQVTRDHPESGGNFEIGKKQNAGISWSMIPILTVSPTGEHIIAVTAEDKCIRVFEINHNGRLSQLSER